MGAPKWPDMDLCEQLAAVAHEAWRRRMIVGGWVFGLMYDEAAKIHDALVPFERLAGEDRRAIVDAVRSEKLEDKLCSLVGYPRGPDRPFTLEEMRPGLPVTSAIEAGSAGSLHGVVESWEEDGAGSLRVIRVRWADGDLTEHHPATRELRRPGS